MTDHTLLVIDPTECIDCTLCELECPANAIFSDSEIPQDQAKFIELNKLYSKEWLWVSEAKNCAPNTDQWNGIKNKLYKISGYLSDDELTESLQDPNTADLIIQTYKLTKKQIEAALYNKIPSIRRAIITRLFSQPPIDFAHSNEQITRGLADSDPTVRLEVIK